MGAQNYVSHHAWRCNKRAFRSQLRWWIGRHFIFIFVSSMNHVAHLLPAQRREGTAAKMSRLKLWSLGSLGPTKTGCGNWSKEHQNHTICQVTLVSLYVYFRQSLSLNFDRSYETNFAGNKHIWSSIQDTRLVPCTTWWALSK